MPSIVKVKNWYAQSFQDLIELQTPQISTKMKEQLIARSSGNLPHSVPNPSLARVIKPQAALGTSVPISHR